MSMMINRSHGDIILKADGKHKFSELSIPEDLQLAANLEKMTKHRVICRMCDEGEADDDGVYDEYLAGEWPAKAEIAIEAVKLAGFTELESGAYRKADGSTNPVRIRLGFGDGLQLVCRWGRMDADAILEHYQTGKESPPVWDIVLFVKSDGQSEAEAIVSFELLPNALAYLRHHFAGVN